MTGYFKGDAIRFTGKTLELHGGLFFEFVYEEGHKKGETGVTQYGPDGAHARREAERKKAERKDEQDGFRRLNG